MDKYNTLEEAAKVIQDNIQRDEQYKQIVNDKLLSGCYNTFNVLLETTPEEYINKLPNTINPKTNKKHIKPMLTSPIERTKYCMSILKVRSLQEEINTDSRILKAPFIYPYVFYKHLYPYRLIEYNNKIMFQLEYTLDITDNLWKYIIEQELKWKNPNTKGYSIKFIPGIEEDVSSGYEYFAITHLNELIDNFEPGSLLYNVIDNDVKRLQISVKLEMLENKLYPIIRKYPRHEKHVLGATTNQKLLDAKVLIEEASAIKSLRATKLKEALTVLRGLDSLIKTAFNRRFISFGAYTDIIKHIHTIISMVVNFLKSTLKPKNQQPVLIR